MVNAYLKNEGPMIALMRISIVYKDGKVVHNNVPYVFVSGKSVSNAIARWKEIHNEILSSQYSHLYSAINQKTGYGYKPPIYSIVKGINDYGFWCDSKSSQFYSHAERACILALMYDTQHSLAAVINETQQPNTFIQPLEAVNSDVRKIVVQIKISHKIGAVCNECFRFLTGGARWTMEKFDDNLCNKFTKEEPSNNIFYMRKYLRDLGDQRSISISIPIEIRISSNDLVGCRSVTCRFSY